MTPRKGKKLDESLIVRCGLTGETLLAVTEGDLEWPDEDRALYKSDVLSILRIPVTQFALVDIVHGRPTMHCEPNLVEDGEHMHFGDEYIFCKRQCPRCPRCTICGKCCTRAGDHSICSHGNIDHLWCAPPNEHTEDEVRIFTSAEGYVNGSGLLTRFTEAELRRELPVIAKEYNLKLPLPVGFAALPGPGVQ